MNIPLPPQSPPPTNTDAPTIPHADPQQPPQQQPAPKLARYDRVLSLPSVYVKTRTAPSTTTPSTAIVAQLHTRPQITTCSYTVWCLVQPGGVWPLLLDSGCTIDCVIRKSVLPPTLQLRPSPFHTADCANSSSIVILGETTVNITIASKPDNYKVSTTAIVAEDLVAPIILGGSLVTKMYLEGPRNRVTLPNGSRTNFLLVSPSGTRPEHSISQVGNMTSSPNLVLVLQRGQLSPTSVSESRVTIPNDDITTITKVNEQLIELNMLAELGLCEQQRKKVSVTKPNGSVVTTTIPDTSMSDKWLELLQKQAHIFACAIDQFGTVNSDKFVAKLHVHGPPICLKNHSIPFHLRGPFSDEFAKLVKNDILAFEASPWNSPSFAQAKQNGGVRFLTDLRAVNDRVKSRGLIRAIPDMEFVLERLKRKGT